MDGTRKKLYYFDIMVDARKSSPSSIPAFVLYGEAGVDGLDLLHIELIRSRSEHHHWEINTHIHKALLQAVVIRRGEGITELDGQAYRLTPAMAVIIPPGVAHAFRFAPDTDGYVLTVAASLPLRLADASARNLLAAQLRAPTLVRMGGAAPDVWRLLDMLLRESRQARPARAQLSEWLATSVLLILGRDGVLARQARAQGRHELFQRFRALVEDHVLDHWPVVRYARALGITERRLDLMCRAVAGRSAFDLAQERLLVEAQRRLVYIEAPAASLAYELGFSDPAYFNRFFKKRTGLTPAAFRRARRDELADATKLHNPNV